MDQGDAVDKFFGSDHYVEVKDQLFGSYGGVQRLRVLNDKEVMLHLVKDVPGVGRDLIITTVQPMGGQGLDHVRSLERS
jgi:hypothetical protein